MPLSHWLGAAYVAIATFLIGFIPLFGGPGYEQALATGLLVPGAAAVVTAMSESRVRREPSEAVAHGLAVGGAFGALSLLTALAHVARVGACDLGSGVVYFGLTAGAGCLMGGLWGAVVGVIVGRLFSAEPLMRPASVWRYRRTWSIVLAMAGPIATVAMSLVRFYRSPMIFAYDPFVGYFSGTLYDTVVDPGAPLVTYRLGSLFTLLAVVNASRVLRTWDAARERLALDLRGAGARLSLSLAIVCASASVGVALSGERLGHVSTRDGIAAELGGQKHGERCDVIYPASLGKVEADLLVQDCDEEVASMERRLELRGPDRVVAFFFRDADQKRRLMGAAHTYIAKPWRHEVYLQVGGYPHPVLGHEIAHVIAGSIGRGPFRIAGALGGWVPNPGLIEGIAVFGSPNDDDLTEGEWASAMARVGLVPPMERIFSLGFLGQSSAKSYTLAGAFVGWIRDRFGMRTVHAWFGGANLPAVTGASWAELDRQFGAHLSALTLPQEAQAVARARFDRPSVFGRTCPHWLDAIRQKADSCRDTQRVDEASALYRSIFEQDPQDWSARHAFAALQRRLADRVRGQAELLSLSTNVHAPVVWRDRAIETMADAEFVEGDFTSSASRYEELASRTLDEDFARTLEVKALGARRPEARAAVMALLLGRGQRGPDVFLGGLELGSWSTSTPGDALSSYLIGRNLVSRGFYAEGAKMLGNMGEREPTARVAREALRLRAVAACATRDDAALTDVRTRVGSDSGPFYGSSGGRRASVLRMIDRCARRL